MIFIQSIIVYFLTALILFYLGKSVNAREKAIYKSKKKYLSFYSLEIILSILVFAIIAGMRYQVGVDHTSYLESYREMLCYGHFLRESFEPGFVFLTQIFAYFKIHFFFYFAFLAALQIGFIYYAFRKEKYLLCYIGICIILGTYFLSWMNGIRQCIVVCAFVPMIKLIEKKKIFWYMILIMLAYTIHKSAVILIPFYFILQYDFKLVNRKFWIFIAVVCAFIGNTPKWLHMISFTENILSFIGYNTYADHLDKMLNNSRFLNWGPGRLSIFIMGLIIIWFYPQMRTYYVQQRRKLGIYFILFLIGVCSYNLFANTSHIFLRPITYFTIFTLPLTAYLLYYLRMNKSSLHYYAFLLLACSYMGIDITKTFILPYCFDSDFILYKFFWNYV